jgi:hypothetical protein
MKNESTGGPAAENNADTRIEARLARHFAAELERAEQDYPTLGRLRRVNVEPSRRAGRAWPRLAMPLVGVAMLAVIGLVGVGLAFRPGTEPAGPAGGSGAAPGSGGIPSQIDGQRVYRLSEKAEWQNLSGSFLLGAYPIDFFISCPAPASPEPSGADASLIGYCNGTALQDDILEVGVTEPGPGSVYVAPESTDLLNGWLNGPAIVMRVHTHDAEAAQCSADQQPACDDALVVEAVVWPEVPAQLNGERVYRGTDQASFPTSGSFLLGGRVTKPSVMPPCPMQIDTTAAEQQLIPYCYVLSIDGLDVAPMSNLDEPNNEIVVARVHIDDPLAAQCPASTRPACEASIVVESVAWRSDVLVSASPSDGSPSNNPTANPASSGAAGASADVPSAGPSFAIPTVSTSLAPPPPPASVEPIDSGGAAAPSPTLPSPWSSAGPVQPATAPAAGG